MSLSWSKVFLNHAANSVGIEDTLAVSNVLWPTIVEDDGYVFVADFYNQNLERLKTQFHNDKRTIERQVNAWSLADFFLMASSPSVDSEVLITKFGEMSHFFWSLRLKTLFPEREFIVDVDENIEGERGLSITFYEK